MKKLVVRWTIGDVNDAGFEALRLSVKGVQRLFGRSADYVVCVNTIGAWRAQKRCGEVLHGVEWVEVDRSMIPRFIRERFDSRLAEGAGWKLAPVRLHNEHCSISLDNDVILWARPRAVHALLTGAAECVLAEDVVAAYGIFGAVCPGIAYNGGIRGLAAAVDYEGLLREVLKETTADLTSELDEQGLQVAALCRAGPAIVSLQEVPICSPFYPHHDEPGTCGAHFVGINSRNLPWEYYGRPATEVRREHWERWRPEIALRVGRPRNEPLEAPQTPASDSGVETSD